MVVVVVAVLSVVMTLAIAELGGRSVDRIRAQTAADAGALAGLAGGPARATELAARHGATVVSWRTGPGPDGVTVTVRIGDATAVASATDAP